MKNIKTVGGINISCEDTKTEFFIMFFCVFLYMNGIIKYVIIKVNLCLILSLREKSPNMEFFLVCIFPYSEWSEYGDLLHKSPYSVRIRKNTDQKKLRIRALFTQCVGDYLLLLPWALIDKIGWSITKLYLIYLSDNSNLFNADWSWGKRFLDRI